MKEPGSSCHFLGKTGVAPQEKKEHTTHITNCWGARYVVQAQRVHIILKGWFVWELHSFPAQTPSQKSTKPQPKSRVMNIISSNPVPKLESQPLDHSTKILSGRPHPLGDLGDLRRLGALQEPENAAPQNARARALASCGPENQDRRSGKQIVATGFSKG